MSEVLRSWAQAVAASAPHDWAIYCLRNIPGFPPIVQTIHILSIVAIVASTFFVLLRVLGLATPSQQLKEMVPRLMPWTWWALPILLLTGSVFVLARPQRYFLNPVFGIKLVSIALAISFTVLVVRTLKNSTYDTPGFSTKMLAAMSLICWVLIIFAGRWIAYVDYLFPRS